MRYERMTKSQLLEELLDRGIACFSEEDSSETLIEALYRDDEYGDEFPEAYHKPVKGGYYD